MNILVTGSKGFVGQRLAEELRKNSHRAKEFDAKLGSSILDKEQCMQACKGIDVVYHLAAVLDEDGKNLFAVNVQGTENILEAAAKARCRQFIFLSTAGVNAGCKGIVDENSAFKPITKYEKSKAEAEKIAIEAQEIIPITVIRSALVFGPNEYWKKIIPLIKNNFPIIGNGKQVWQTIFVDDLVSALVFALGKEECLGETFLVAEQEKHSLRELYAEMQKQLGIKAEIKSIPAWLAKILAFFYSLSGKKSIVSLAHIGRLARERNYNTSKINKLGWKAKTPMRIAVKETIEALKA